MHRESEAPTRAWSKAVSLQVDKMPPAGVLERFEKRSVITARPAIKQALVPSCAKVEERQRVHGTVVTFTPSVAASTSLPVPPTCATTQRFGKLPPVNDIERSEERSDAMILVGPAVE